MKLAIYRPSRLPFSLRRYLDKVTEALPHEQVALAYFRDAAGVPTDSDLVWDPRAAGGVAPPAWLRKSARPFVITIHGAARFVLPPGDYFSSLSQRVRSWARHIGVLRRWESLGHECQFIAVSQYARSEVISCLGLPADRVTSIYHGVDHSVFCPVSEEVVPATFLHVSQFQPKKNLKRIVEAWRRVRHQQSVRLRLIVPGMPTVNREEGLEIVRTPQTAEHVAAELRTASAFIFPSLHETFGMPLVEAMASGCPVITSNSSACAEVAADAALLVDPRSVEEIAAAMKRLLDDEGLRRSLRERGFERAREFSWEKSAQMHVEIFTEAARSPG